MTKNNITGVILSNYAYYDEIVSYYSQSEIINRSDNYIVKAKNAINNKVDIFLNDIIPYINKEELDQIISLTKQNNLKLVIFTTNAEDLLLTDYSIIYKDNLIALEGKTKDVLSKDIILKRLGIGLPFIVDLSIQLKLYNIINKIYYSIDEMVDSLWK